MRWVRFMQETARICRIASRVSRYFENCRSHAGLPERAGFHGRGGVHDMPIEIMQISIYHENVRPL